MGEMDTIVLGLRSRKLKESWTPWRMRESQVEAEIKPLYCKKCGNRLVPDTTITEYDEFTGMPIRPFLNNLACPDRVNHSLEDIQDSLSRWLGPPGKN